MTTKKAVSKKNKKQSDHAPKITAHDLAKGQREISVSEFFTKNRHLLGFDNPRKALLTTIKEGMDNSLDACEEAKILPDIKINIEQVNNAEGRFRVTIEDNGPGILKSQMPRIFGKLLYGSKFHRLKMSRGQQGIGISAAGMYGQLTTGKPVLITSKISPKKPAHHYSLVIDTQKNEPKIIKDVEVKWDTKHGTKVVIELEAKYQKGRQSVDDYIEQTAIANPHADIIYINPEGEKIRYSKTSKELPVEPKEIKPHPYGIELGILIKMLHDTKAKKLQSFLMKDFSRVSAKVAKEICKKANLYEKARPTRIAAQEADALYKAIKLTKIMNPPTDCISPIGDELIIQGLKKQINADFFVSNTRAPTVYRGNPFLVEVGLAYGGDLPEEGLIRLLRFANRVPLQYQQSACVITESVINTAWRNYGLQQSSGALPTGPVILMVHLASVWVPFTSESKESIAPYPEIEKEIKLALQECGRHLSKFIKRKKKAAEEIKKKSYIKKYIPHIGIALKEILNLNDKQERKIVNILTDILERSRS
ncbi:MAG: DNA topoisomerase VI subunit B [Candidatus Scalindua sediminis]